MKNYKYKTNQISNVTNLNKKGASIWDILAWIALIGLGVWLLLKILGIIQTPPWLEYAPLYGVIYIAGWAMHKLHIATDNIKEIRKDVKEIETDVNKIRVNCPILLKK